MEELAVSIGLVDCLQVAQEMVLLRHGILEPESSINTKPMVRKFVG